MNIGMRIRQLREAKGWTTNRLANLCGLSQSFLRAVEMEEKGISVESLSLICDTLGVSLRSFFDVPDVSDAETEMLQRKIEQLSSEQKVALSSFLDTML